MQGFVRSLNVSHVSYLINKYSKWSYSIDQETIVFGYSGGVQYWIDH